VLVPLGVSRQVLRCWVQASQALLEQARPALPHPPAAVTLARILSLLLSLRVPWLQMASRARVQT
jgi:hypothetical protein